MRIHLINPSDVSFGVAVITPRWQYVLAAATPREYGDPNIVDETLEHLSLAGPRVTALALVFSELLGNALEHGGPHIHIDLHRHDGEVVLAVSDDGAGIADDTVDGTGLSIVRALVRDELRGSLGLIRGERMRAEVRFPA